MCFVNSRRNARGIEPRGRLVIIGRQWNSTPKARSAAGSVSRQWRERPINSPLEGFLALNTVRRPRYGF